VISSNKPSNPLRHWSYQFALFVGALLAALLCLEIGFRLARRGEIGFDRLGWEEQTGGKQSGRIYEKTSEFEFTTTTNALGFRGPEIAIEKAPGTKRLLILGDSFTFGWGVNDDQLFTADLEKQLKKSRDRFQIINTSGGSLSPLVYYVRLKNSYIRLEPDVVLVFLNYADLREDFTFKKNIRRDERGEIVEINPLYTDGHLDTWRWLRSRSEFLSFTYNKFNRTFRRIQVLGLWGYIKAKLRGENIRDAMFEGDRAGPDRDAIEYDAYFMLRDHVKPELIRKHLAETTEYIAKMHELIKARRASLILVLLPNGAQVGSGQWSQGRLRWGFDLGRQYENPAMIEGIATFAKNHGIGFVNMIDVFKKHDSQRLFFERDGHFLPEGHAVLAEGLLASPDVRAALSLP
jgi:lysophospholipase L1-like esterase